MAQLKPVQIDTALLLATGTSITETAEKSAITRQTIHSWLKDNEFQAYINALKKENISAVRASIQSAATVAVKTIENIMNESANDAVRFSCAKEILSMAGFTKETNSMLNKDIGSDTAEGVAEEREKERKYQAKMKMFDL